MTSSLLPGARLVSFLDYLLHEFNLNGGEDLLTTFFKEAKTWYEGKALPILFYSSLVSSRHTALDNYKLVFDEDDFTIHIISSSGDYFSLDELKILAFH